MYTSKAACVRCASRIPIAVGRTSIATYSTAKDASSTPTKPKRHRSINKGDYVSKRYDTYGGKGKSSDPFVQIFRDVVSLRKHIKLENTTSKNPSKAEPKDDKGKPDDTLPQWKKEAMEKVLEDPSSFRIDDGRFAYRYKQPHPEIMDEQARMFEANMHDWSLEDALTRLKASELKFPDKVNLLERLWPRVRDLPRHPRPQIFNEVEALLMQLFHMQGAYFRQHCTIRLSKMMELVEYGHPRIKLRASAVLNLGKLLLRGKASSLEQFERMIELVDLWKHISQLGKPEQDELSWALPSVFDATDAMLYGSRGRDCKRDGLVAASTAMVCMFPHLPISHARHLQSSLILTITMLMDPELTHPSVKKEASPLLHLAASVFSETRPPNKDLVEKLWDDEEAAFDGVVHDFSRPYVVENWDKTWKALQNELDSIARAAEQAARTKKATVHTPLSTLHRQLRQAHRARNVGAALQVFDSLQQQASKDVSMRNQLQDEPDLLNYVVFVWGALRRPSEMQQTLALMQKLRIKPTIKTYTAMMHGWKMSKDYRRSEALWNQIRASGMPLDLHIWTARVSTLLEMGRPEQGMQELVGMVNLWKTQAPNAVEPDIEVVNAVFKTLIVLDRKAAQDLLAWASREGMQPSIVTYNILLTESFRSHPEAVPSILKNMHAASVEPDSATFTIILEAVLGALTESTGEEQVQAVDQIFADIESAGLRPNQETLAKILYSICTLPNGSEAAIQRVLAKVSASGYVITPHMITILIERAMARDPPDIVAVEDILRRYEIRTVSDGDQVLWERVMSAYAVSRDWAAALRIFNELDAAGRTATSLSCLTDLLTALVDGEERRLDEAKEMVSAVLRSKGDFDQRGRYWKHHFWFRAKALGLVDRELAPGELVEEDDFSRRDWAESSGAKGV